MIYYIVFDIFNYGYQPLSVDIEWRQAMATFGYGRVSTELQEYEKFETAILKYANSRGLVPVVEFVGEKVSGTKDWKRRKLGQLINETCKEGDIIIVPELSRLARSIKQTYEIMEACSEKNIALHIVKDNLIVSVNDTSITGKLTLGICAVFAEFERDIIAQRTKEALEVKKANGVKLGRPKGKYTSQLDKHKDEILKLKSSGSTNVWLANEYGVAPQTLANWLKKVGYKKTK